MALIHMATPRAMPIMASVVRKDGMPIPVVSQPLTAPTIAPVRKAADDAAEHAEMVDAHGGRDRGEARHRADRQVDLGGAEHEGHRHGHDRDDGGLADDVEKVVGVEEAPLVRASRRR